MIGEIDNDRRHERYLLRAGLLAALVIGLALAVAGEMGMSSPHQVRGRSATPAPTTRPPP